MRRLTHHPLLAVVLLVFTSRPADAQAAAAQPPAAAPSSAPSVRLTGYIQARETYRDGVGLTGSINPAAHRLRHRGYHRDLADPG
jgi:hypothetical protein